MRESDLKRAKILVDVISEINNFLRVIDPDKNLKRGSGSWDINAIFKIETINKFKIFGSRWFGLGVSRQEINIPNELIDILHSEVLKYKIELQEELKSI